MYTIFLIEASFNAMHKAIFNNRLIPSIEVVDAIPIEIIGERGPQVATHLVLNKKLTSNAVNIRKLPSIAIYSDVKN